MRKTTYCLSSGSACTFLMWSSRAYSPAGSFFMPSSLMTGITLSPLISVPMAGNREGLPSSPSRSSFLPQGGTPCIPRSPSVRRIPTSHSMLSICFPARRSPQRCRCGPDCHRTKSFPARRCGSLRETVSL